jgi:hypothetical protein
MDQFCRMSALHSVRCDGSLLLHHMTSWRHTVLVNLTPQKASGTL